MHILVKYVWFCTCFYILIIIHSICLGDSPGDTGPQATREFPNWLIVCLTNELMSTTCNWGKTGRLCSSLVPRSNCKVWTVDSRTCGLTDSYWKWILADVEHTINIKWASRAAVCSWESLNSGKTFCQTSIDALKWTELETPVWELYTYLLMLSLLLCFPYFLCCMFGWVVMELIVKCPYFQ